MNKLVLTFAVLLSITLTISAIEVCRAHDPGRPELNDWFNKLASGKGLCCSFADGTAIPMVDWETKGGKYRVRIDNEWIDVPEDAVITEPNRAGRTMVWPMRGYLGTSIRCFMPGSYS